MAVSSSTQGRITIVTLDRPDVRNAVDGVTAEELEGARQGWLEGRQLGRAQDPSLAGAIAQNLYFDRTFGFLRGEDVRAGLLQSDDGIDSDLTTGAA